MEETGPRPLRLQTDPEILFPVPLPTPSHGACLTFIADNLAGTVRPPVSPPSPAQSCFSTVQPHTRSPKCCTDLLFQLNRFCIPLSLTATPQLGIVLPGEPSPVFHVCVHPHPRFGWSPLLAEADAVLLCPLHSPSNNPGRRCCSPVTESRNPKLREITDLPVVTQLVIRLEREFESPSGLRKPVGGRLG